MLNLVLIIMAMVLAKTNQLVYQVVNVMLLENVLEACPMFVVCRRIRVAVVVSVKVHRSVQARRAVDCVPVHPTSNAAKAVAVL